jgi:hypothetical protein
MDMDKIIKNYSNFNVLIPLVIFSNLGFRIHKYIPDTEYYISVPEDNVIPIEYLVILNDYYMKYHIAEFDNGTIHLLDFIYDANKFCKIVAMYYAANINIRRSKLGLPTLNKLIKFIAGIRHDTWDIGDLFDDINFIEPVIESIELNNEVAWLDDEEFLYDGIDRNDEE